MDGTIAEVKLFGSHFAPRNFAKCEGQLIAISSNTALFSLIGTIYAGDGRTTFGLPDLRGRHAIGPGEGPGLDLHLQGNRGGAEYRTLSILQMPAHNHSAVFDPIAPNSDPTHDLAVNGSELMVSSKPGTTNVPTADTVLAAGYAGFNPVNNYIDKNSAGTLVPLAGTVQGQIDGQVYHPSYNGGNVNIGITGASQSIDIRNPYTAIPYIICMFGIYPLRN